MPIGVGTGPGSDAILQGQKGGFYQATLTAAQMASIRQEINAMDNSLDSSYEF